MNKEASVKNDCRGLEPNEIIEKIMVSRNIKDVDHFINPTENDLLPLTDLLRIDEATNILLNGIKENKRFCVYFDTDTDGICSGTEMVRYLKDYGVDSQWIINEGKKHGVTKESLDSLKDIDILIIVDSLNTDIDIYKKIYDMGVETIVLDHHDINKKLESEYDKYIVLVSSNRNYKNNKLCGAGVVWKFLKYIDELTGTIYADKYVDLAATGTIGDMMLLDSEHFENRYIVSHGLDNLNNLALKKMIGGYSFTSTSISYSIAPLINAANRMNKNEYAVKALLSDENSEVLKYIKKLKKCKADQNKEIDCLMPDIIKQVEKQEDKKFLNIIIDTDSGITGLLANKVLGIYQKPVFILKKNLCGYSGSCRSNGYGNFLDFCINTGLGQFGGHEESFGIIDIPYENYDLFIKKVEKELNNLELKKTLEVDAELDMNDINRELINNVKIFDKVSGQGSKQLTFKIKCNEFEVSNMSQGKHLVVKPCHDFMFIKWNCSNRFEEMEDHALLGDEITFIGSLTDGFIGKKHFNQMICDEIIEECI